MPAGKKVPVVPDYLLFCRPDFTPCALDTVKSDRSLSDTVSCTTPGTVYSDNNRLSTPATVIHPPTPTVDLIAGTVAESGSRPVAITVSHPTSDTVDLITGTVAGSGSRMASVRAISPIPKKRIVHHISEKHREKMDVKDSSGRFIENSLMMGGTVTNGRGMNRTTASKGLNTTSASTVQNYVGFANFPNQVFRRAIRNGFEFTLMVVGRSGLGKSTFINTLFLAEINDPDQSAALTTPPGSTVRIEQKTVRLVENGVSLNLTLVDTPGFGGAIDNSKCWEPIQQFVDARYLDYFCEETKLERAERMPDRCVHLCLYFVAPSGHGLDVLDIEFMKRLHDRVNIVPVIAKADSLTKDEMKKFKAQMLRDLETHGIKVYKFPESEDIEERKQMEVLRQRVPFAVVGSNTVKEEGGAGGKRTRYREYAWGTVEVENMEHNDFMALRDMVIRTNMIDLIDVTHDVHYENFRCRQMGNLPKGQQDRDPFTTMEDDKKQRERDMTEKKRSMDKLFEDKVRDREAKIRDRTQKQEARQKEILAGLEAKRAELELLRNSVSEMRRGNLTDSKSSIFSSSGSENVGKSSPQEKIKKKTGTLGLFNRN